MLPAAIDTAAFVENDQPTFANQGLLSGCAGAVDQR
jgi:hypothetical protein